MVGAIFVRLIGSVRGQKLVGFVQVLRDFRVQEDKYDADDDVHEKRGRYDVEKCPVLARLGVALVLELFIVGEVVHIVLGEKYVRQIAAD